MKSGVLLSLGLVAIFAFPHVRAAQTAAANKTAPPPRPALPPLRSLKTEPASLTLEDGRDERRVLVWGESASGQRFDVTDDAVLKSESPEIEIDNTGYIRPKGQGQAEVTVATRGPATARRKAKTASNSRCAATIPNSIIRRSSTTFRAGVSTA